MLESTNAPVGHEAKRYEAWLWIHTLTVFAVPLVFAILGSREDPLLFKGVAEMAIISPLVLCNAIFGIRAYYKLCLLDVSHLYHYILACILGVSALFGAIGTIVLIVGSLMLGIHRGWE